MGKKSNQARFPLARIKKMIQADEEVGKVAAATPIVVSKALELFLASLVDACVKDAESRGSKKLTPYGLKRAVNTTAMLDFCADIVESVPDPLDGDEDDAAGEGSGAGAGKRKRKAAAAGAAPRKKATKKQADSDEDEYESDEGDHKAVKADSDEYEED
ncbi:histone-fold-containing protein [Rhodotorula diobovata]|uniref:Histone-fold-containing protein n=1 Tax=Rhodotorula diobovata TaxID=5288 RepID=A0A5C5G5I8_9BASI|nr:histone-fold-containing protein [Rhodotorula diobovata]